MLFLLVFVSHSGHVLNLQANLRACNEELRSHVDDLKQDLEVQRMAISRSDQEKVLTFNTAYSSHSSTLFHHANMSLLYIPPYTPLLYRKIWVYRGIHYFLIFALKHTGRLWVHIKIGIMDVAIIVGFLKSQNFS